MRTGKNKNRIWQAAVILSAAICICGCGDAKETEAAAEEVTETVNEEVQDTEQDVTETVEEEGTGERAEGYCFIADGIEIRTDMDMDEVKDKLGESQSVYETPSCAGDGTSYIYNYISYEIETYPAGDDKNRIAYIILKDDTIATPEGADLSMTKEDVIRIYGEDYEEIGNKISYEKEETKLNFIFDEDNVISIEYASVVIG